MVIEKSKIGNLNEIMRIYEYARGIMRENGNPNQWKDVNPPKETIIADIENGHHYSMWKDDEICGVFAFIIGEDETYRFIDGKWLNEEIYGTIHRVASSGRVRGIFEVCLAFCESKIPNIRIDTHEDNKIMQHLVEKNGFQECGIITVADGSPRKAYQKEKIG